MKKIILGLMLSSVITSCTVTKSSTAKSLDVYGTVMHIPVVADLNVKQEKVSATLEFLGKEASEAIKNKVIGEALKKAAKKFVGIKRYAHRVIPMDETLTRVAIDVSNRPYLIWKVKLKVEKLGEMDTELFKEWFQAFSQSAGITMHVENIYGDNSHHIIESCYKALARSLREALEMDPRSKKSIPSTKGSL